MLNYHFAYLILDLLFFPIWISLFLLRKDLRRKILTLSFFIGLVAIIGEFWYLRDYWRPLTITNTAMGIEDFFFGFFIGGIGGVIYEELFMKRFSNRHLRRHHWGTILIFAIGICVVLSNILFFYLRLNSMYSSLIAFIVLFVIIVSLRKDLWLDALMSGLLCTGLLFINYIILLTIYPMLFEKMWLLHNLSGLSIARIPIEELLWVLGWGMVGGPIYEFYTGLKLKKIN